MISIFSDISKHPVLSRLMLKHEVDENFIYFQEGCHKPEVIEMLIEEGLAFRI